MAPMSLSTLHQCKLEVTPNQSYQPNCKINILAIWLCQPDQHWGKVKKNNPVTSKNQIIWHSYLAKLLQEKLQTNVSLSLTINPINWLLEFCTGMHGDIASSRMISTACPTASRMCCNVPKQYQQKHASVAIINILNTWSGMLNRGWCTCHHHHDLVDQVYVQEQVQVQDQGWNVKAPPGPLSVGSSSLRVNVVVPPAMIIIKHQNNLHHQVKIGSVSLLTRRMM